jgi:Anti-sigma-K factor rskA
MSTRGHIEQDDLALFAMQLQPVDVAARIGEHVRQCAECQREVATIQGELALYALSVDLHSPPAMSRERLMKQVAREKKVAPITQMVTPSMVAPETPLRTTGTLFGSNTSISSIDHDVEEEEERPRRGLAGWVLPWTGWALAAGLAVVAVSFFQQKNELRNTVAAQAGQLTRLAADAAAARQVMDILNDPKATRVTIQAPLSRPVPQGRATYLPDKGQLIFIANNLDPIQPNKVYELWLIPSDGRAAVPAGTFRPDEHGSAELVLPSLPKGVVAKMFGVTVENQGGATIPTMPILLAGTPS